LRNFATANSVQIAEFQMLKIGVSLAGASKAAPTAPVGCCSMKNQKHHHHRPKRRNAQTLLRGGAGVMMPGSWY
jgi:hypothetical protein